MRSYRPSFFKDHTKFLWFCRKRGRFFHLRNRNNFSFVPFAKIVDIGGNDQIMLYRSDRLRAKDQKEIRFMYFYRSRLKSVEGKHSLLCRPLPIKRLKIKYLPDEFSIKDFRDYVKQKTG